MSDNFQITSWRVIHDHTDFVAETRTTYEETGNSQRKLYRVTFIVKPRVFHHKADAQAYYKAITSKDMRNIFSKGENQ